MILESAQRRGCKRFMAHVKKLLALGRYKSLRIVAPESA
jgi:hypothetical protein